MDRGILIYNAVHVTVYKMKQMEKVVKKGALFGKLRLGTWSRWLSQLFT